MQLCVFFGPKDVAAVKLLDEGNSYRREIGNRILEFSRQADWVAVDFIDPLDGAITRIGELAPSDILPGQTVVLGEAA